MIRAFIAISLDSKIIDKIFDAMSQLKREIPGVRWVAKENLHLTLKFLGPIDEARIDPISGTLARAVRPFSRFTINAKGLGVFPDLKRPRVLWAGLEGGDLPALVGAVESALEPLGFAPETRSFKPHLTVGRWRNFEGSVTRLGREIEKWRFYEFGESKVEEVALFQSVLKRNGAVYYLLSSVALNDNPL